MKDQFMLTIRQDKNERRKLEEPQIVQRRLDYEEKIRKSSIEREIKANEISEKIDKREQRIEKMK